MTFRNFTAKTLFSCINFSIHAFVDFALNVRLFIDDFGWRPLSHFHLQTQKKSWIFLSCEQTTFFESICDASHSWCSMKWSQLNYKTQIARVEEIKLRSRIEVFCKHMLNTIGGAASQLLLMLETFKSSLCEMRKRFEGTRWLPFLSDHSGSAPQFSWTSAINLRSC